MAVRPEGDSSCGVRPVLGRAKARASIEGSEGGRAGHGTDRAQLVDEIQVVRLRGLTVRDKALHEAVNDHRPARPAVALLPDEGPDPVHDADRGDVAASPRPRLQTVVVRV